MRRIDGGTDRAGLSDRQPDQAGRCSSNARSLSEIPQRASTPRFRAREKLLYNRRHNGLLSRPHENPSGPLTTEVIGAGLEFERTKDLLYETQNFRTRHVS